MSIVRFIGDVHGKFGKYKKILEESPYRTHQVGDMGIGFRKWPHGEWSANPPYDLMVEKGATFHRGNHDNPDTCAKHTQCIQDGEAYAGMMFIGGALSIDRDYRIPDYSWWADEELSEERLADLAGKYAEYRPRIMVTHECPETIAERIVGAMPDLRYRNSDVGPGGGAKFTPIKLDPRHASRTRVALQRMFETHQPKLWIFGHWHTPFASTVNGTAFICLPELATIDIDIDNGGVAER